MTFHHLELLYSEYVILGGSGGRPRLFRLAQSVGLENHGLALDGGGGERGRVEASRSSDARPNLRGRIGSGYEEELGGSAAEDEIMKNL